APAAALAGRDAVLHLAGEDVAQRWTDDARRRILESREVGTRHLVAGLRAADPRPHALVSASAVGFYGKHGDEEVPEGTAPGDDFVALYLAALDGEGWSGAYNGTAPAPVTNKTFSHRLGKALRRPAFAPVPAFAIRALYGDMAEIVTEGQRAVPERALAQGFA